jgi:NDP-sugar pyrophosphorylase family protein
MRAVILAAGYGTRLGRDLAADTSGRFAALVGLPKPLLPVGGVPLLTRWVHQLEAEPAITGPIVVVINEFYRALFEAWAAGFPRVTLVSDGSHTNETRSGAVACLQLGAAAAVSSATSDSSVVVVGGDTLYLTDFSLGAVLAAVAPGESACLVYPCDDVTTTKSGIIEVDATMHVTSFLEKPGPAATASRLASPCTYILGPSALVRV